MNITITLPEVVECKGPVLMLNMLKFRDKRLYFEEYIPAFNEVTKLLRIPDIKVVLVTEVLGNILADENEDWDAIAIVEYPSAEAFKAVATSEAYHAKADALRVAATEKLKLIMTRKTEF